MKTDRTNTKHPLDISDMTDEELNCELEKGYARCGREKPCLLTRHLAMQKDCTS
ncbi:MAG: hypothetical protein IKZ82_13250 [Clostridia bacterium]|nr:hypothetical protein [Clostridia bacterium]